LTTPLSTVTIDSLGGPIIVADTGPVTIVNTDSTNTVYIGYNTSVVINNPNSCFPLGPGQGIQVDGTQSIYGIVSGAAVVVGILPGVSNFFNGTVNISGPVTATIGGTVDVDVQNASLDAVVSGTVDVDTPSPINVSAATVDINAVNPIDSIPITNSMLLWNSGTLTPAGGASDSSGTSGLLVSQSGYEIAVYCAAGAASTNPFAEITLQWVDATTLETMATDNWIVPMTSNGIFQWAVFGHGPTKANLVKVSVTNLDTVTARAINVYMFQNTRTYSYDDWRWNNDFNAGFAIPGFTLPSLPNDESNLGTIYNSPCAASASIKILCGMYNGPINFVFGSSADLGEQAIIIQQVPTSIYGQGAYVFNGTGAPEPQIVFGGRAPLLVTISNGAAVTVDETFNMTAQSII
jgi:hypothetical protein